MNEILKIEVPTLPPANDTYSQAVKFGYFIFVAGQTGMDYKSGKIVSEDVGLQTERLFENTKKILEAAGSSLDQVIRVLIFISDKDEVAIYRKRK